MPYRIDFEDEASGTAPAQVVLVTQQLDANLDWSTFQLGDFNISGQTYAVPAGLTSYRTRVDLTSTVGVYVDVNVQFNESTGALTWRFTSLDPATLDIPVGDPEEGFLPPDVAPPEGDVWISYSVEPKGTDTTGTVINAQATVYFNAGLSDQSSLATAPIFNTIDAGTPTSSVASLPAFSLANFTVNWTGQDDANGSCIASYDVYVSDDGGPFMPFQIGHDATSATFTGVVGHTYGFYSVATDNAGNVQPTPASAQETVQIVSPMTVNVDRRRLAQPAEHGGLVASTSHSACRSTSTASTPAASDPHRQRRPISITGAVAQPGLGHDVSRSAACRADHRRRDLHADRQRRRHPGPVRQPRQRLDVDLLADGHHTAHQHGRAAARARPRPRASPCRSPAATRPDRTAARPREWLPSRSTSRRTAGHSPLRHSDARESVRPLHRPGRSHVRLLQRGDR